MKNLRTIIAPHILSFVVIISAFLPTYTCFAQQNSRILQGVWRGEVVEVTNTTKSQVPGTDKVLTLEALKVRLLEGEKKGTVVSVENDYLRLRVGEKVLINFLSNNGVDVYSINERDRRPFLFFLLIVFMAIIIWFSGWQGVRSLASLALTFFVIIYALLPALLHGFSPVIVSTGIATLLLFIAIYITHGFNKDAAITFAGTVIAIIITGILASLSIFITKLTGFSSEDAMRLNFQVPQQLDFVGLLLGGVMIGTLGALYDMAITQVIVVRELYAAAAHLSKIEIYKKALRVGREHIGALVTTLILAYAGGFLPLMLLFSKSPYSFSVIINQEQFAAEIIRTIIGSIGLVLTVPITTALAVYMIERSDAKNAGVVHQEHSHGHSHTHGHSH